MCAQQERALFFLQAAVTSVKEPLGYGSACVCELLIALGSALQVAKLT